MESAQERGLAALLAAAAANGLSRAQTLAFLATAWVESRWNPGAVGDSGTSYGLFQNRIGGLGGPTKQTAKRFANPSYSATQAAIRFKRDNITTGAGAAASQRPANRSAYAKSVNAKMKELAAAGIVGSSATGAAASPAPDKQSPTRAAVRRKASQLGLRHTSGDRTPERNKKGGGVQNSYHLTSRPDKWADDYVGKREDMDALVRWARTQPGVEEAMVHDAGSGLHAHIGGSATGGGTAAGSGGAVGAASADAGNGLARTFGIPGYDLPTLPDSSDVLKVVVKGVVLGVGLALGAGLVYRAVDRLSGGAASQTVGLAAQGGMMAATKGKAGGAK
jgi:hypothetical protein